MIGPFFVYVTAQKLSSALQVSARAEAPQEMLEELPVLCHRLGLCPPDSAQLRVVMLATRRVGLYFRTPYQGKTWPFSILVASRRFPEFDNIQRMGKAPKEPSPQKPRTRTRRPSIGEPILQVLLDNPGTKFTSEDIHAYFPDYTFTTMLGWLRLFAQQGRVNCGRESSHSARLSYWVEEVTAMKT